MDESGLSALGSGPSRIIDIAVDDYGRVWAINNSTLSAFNGQSWTDCQKPDGVYTLEAIAIDPDGRIWLGHYEGVSVLDKGQWLTYSSDEFGLGDFADLINDVAVDHQGRTWVATSSGVAVLDGDSWTPYDESSGLTYDSTTAIVVDYQGKVWVAHSYGVDVFDGSNWTFYGEKYDKEAKIEVEELSGVSALAVDGQNSIWAGTSAYGVCNFNGNDWTNYNGREYLYGAGVNAIACDSQGRVWIGTNFGLAVFDGDNWFHYTKNSSSLISNSIDAILVIGNGPSSLPQAQALEPGNITGKIQRDGQPVAGATVVVCWQTVLVSFGESPCSGDSYSAVTDENGEFFISNVPPYKYGLAIQDPEGEWQVLMGYIHIIDGETTDLGTLSI
jgi:ligand-binding sensor domain-containing protein